MAHVCLPEMQALRFAEFESIDCCQSTGWKQPEHIYIVAKICKSAIESNNNNNNYQIITQKLKQAFNEEWFVFISESNDDNFEFKFSEINDEDIMAFRYKQFIVYICSI